MVLPPSLALRLGVVAPGTPTPRSAPEDTSVCCRPLPLALRVLQSLETQPIRGPPRHKQGLGGFGGGLLSQALFSLSA